MSRSARIAVAAALLLGGTSLATAKTRGGPARTAIVPHPGINETTSRPIVADPYYRLPDRTMVIPISSKAYSTSMLCRLSVPVTATVT
jgi:hypothetical protein